MIILLLTWNKRTTTRKTLEMHRCSDWLLHGNGLYWLVFSYRLSDQFVYEIFSRSDIIGGQLQVY